MKCLKCQYAMPFQERICRRCQYCAELDSYVRTEAPRASGAGVQQKRWHLVLRERLTPKSLKLRNQFRVSPVMVLVASVIPGLGQILLGRTLVGILGMVLTVGLIFIALFSSLSTEPSLVILGLAFGVHVATLFRTTSTAEQENWTSRAAGHLIIFGVLALLVYSPLSTLLRNWKPQYTYMRTWAPMSAITSTLTFAAQLLIFSILLSWIATRLLVKR